MKMLIKRVFAMMLALCLAAAFPLAASGADKTAAEDGDSAEAYRRLGVLGVFGSEEAETPADEGIDRAKLTELLLRLIGVNDDVAQLSKEKAYFTDVTVASSAAGYINTAYERGIVSGDALGKFLPDDTITLSEACKMFTAALGYKPQAEEAGGYPAGYVLQCSRLGVLDGVDKTERKLTYRDAALMLYNSLSVPYVSMGSGGDNSYVISEDTVLSEFFNVSDGSGIYEGNRYTHIYGGETRQDEVVIGGITFKTENCYPELVGMSVKYYYRTNDADGTRTLLFMTEDKNRVLTIGSEDLIGFDGARGVYTYTENDKSRYATLAGEYCLVYNNRFVMSAKSEYYIPKEGSVRLIDNDGDGLCEVVSVRDWQNKIIKSVNAESELLMFETEKGVKYISLSGSDYYVYDAGGAEITLSELKDGDAVAILQAASGDKPMYTIYRLDAPREGTVKEVYKDRIVLSDGTEFKLDGNPDNHYHTEDIKAGVSGRFIFNAEGKVFAYLKTSAFTDKEPCVLIQATEEGGFSGGIRLRVLRFSGKVETVLTADRFTLSYPDPSNRSVRLEKKITSSQNALDEAFAEYSADGYVIRELALVSFNSDNRITSIELPTLANNLVYGNDGTRTEPDLTGDGLHAYNTEFQNFHQYVGQWIRYTSYNHEYNMSEMIMGAEQPYYFSIPAVHDSSRVEKDYKLTSSFKKETDYDMKLYGLTSGSETVEIGICRGALADIPTNEYYAVERISKTIVDEVETMQLEAYNGTSKVSFYFDLNDADVNIPVDLGAGDLVRIGADSDGNIVSLYRYVKFDETQNKPVRGEKLTFTVSDRDGLGGEYHYRFGIAYKSLNERGVYFCSDEQLSDYNKIVDICEKNQFATVMVFNRRLKSWSPGTYKDILCYADAGDKASYISYKTKYNDQERLLYIYDMQS